MKSPQAFRKGAVLAILLIGSMAFTIFLAGCKSESPETQTSEAIKTSMTETAETAETLAKTGTEAVEDIGPGWEFSTGKEMTEEPELAASGRGYSVGGEMLQVAETTREGAIEAGTGLVSSTVSGEVIGEARETLAATPFEERTFGECLAQVEIPPQFQSVTEQVLIPETGEYQTVTKKALISEGRTEERAIVCEADIKKDLVMEIQNALAEEGFDPGPVNGTIGPMTMGALNGYQKANNLPVDKHLNVATIKALGLMP